MRDLVISALIALAALVLLVASAVVRGDGGVPQIDCAIESTPVGAVVTAARP